MEQSRSKPDPQTTSAYCPKCGNMEQAFGGKCMCWMDKKEPQTTPYLEMISEATINNLVDRITVNNLHWKDKDINITGYDFKNCRFDNCKLEAKSGAYSLENCLIEGGSFYVI